MKSSAIGATHALVLAPLIGDAECYEFGKANLEPGYLDVDVIDPDAERQRVYRTITDQVLEIGQLTVNIGVFRFIEIGRPALLFEKAGTQSDWSYVCPTTGKLQKSHRRAKVGPLKMLGRLGSVRQFRAIAIVRAAVRRAALS